MHLSARSASLVGVTTQMDESADACVIMITCAPASRIAPNSRCETSARPRLIFSEFSFVVSALLSILGSDVFRDFSFVHLSTHLGLKFFDQVLELSVTLVNTLLFIIDVDEASNANVGRNVISDEALQAASRCFFTHGNNHDFACLGQGRDDIGVLLEQIDELRGCSLDSEPRLGVVGNTKGSELRSNGSDSLSNQSNICLNVLMVK